MASPHTGFETIGNATLIVYDDGRPVLATDPWITGGAYFGSWGLSHEIPQAQLRAIESAEHIWVSHGHPDHLSMPSLELLRGRPILLPDHRGSRIADALAAEGYEVRVLRDRTWHELSDHVRICSIADRNQDAVLLVDVDGVLVADVNDASDRGWGSFVARCARRYDTAFLMALSGYGDANMINFIGADGKRIPPTAARRIPPGIAITRRMRELEMTHFVPFASHHQYERTDSAWANEFTTPVEDHELGFDTEAHTFVPPFMQYCCSERAITHIRPEARSGVFHEPSAFGDDWTEDADRDDVKLIETYFQHAATLQRVVDSIEVGIGRTEIGIRIGRRTGRAVRFEAPRRSFTDSVRWRIFDDLLIGNYMRTILSGRWTPRDFGRDFTPLLAKYGDNGLAYTSSTLRAYKLAYEARAPLDMARWHLSNVGTGVLTNSARAVRQRLRSGSYAQRMGSSAYRHLRSR